jgi:hypothetical protein
LPQPQTPPNVILQPHPGIVHVFESLVQHHNDGLGILPTNPSSRANKRPINPPPPPLHNISTNAYFPSPPVQPILPIHIVATHESMPPPPPPPKYHKTTPHGSQIGKGKKPIISTMMTKSSSSTHSKMKSASSGKISLNDFHPEVAQLQENKTLYVDFIGEREEFKKKRKKIHGLF